MNKWLASLLLGVALLAGATVVALAQRHAEAALASQPSRSTTRPAQPLGVNVALERYDAPQRAETLHAITATGFGWVRQRFPWEQVEQTPGAYDWAAWDDIVADVIASGLELVAVLDGSPSWARSPQDAANPLAPPASRADFGHFAAAFAARYGGDVHFYQVWDEPNIAPHWGDGFVDAADYAGLLREAAIQLRSADPDAQILLAALAPNIEAGGLNHSDLAYLDALYAAGAAPWFDAVAAQPYGFDRPPDDPPANAALNFRRVELLRQVMLRRNDADTPIWLTAFGWHSSDAGGPSPWQSVAPAVQASWAVDATEWARRQWDWAAGLAWAAWQPSQPAGDPRWGFALAAPDGKPGPTLASLSDWAQAAHPLGPGIWPPDTTTVQAEGGWRLTNLGADPPHGAALENNRLRIPFEGTSLALDVQRGPYWGYLDVAVDGQPANALPRDAEGRANLVLHDPLGQPATVVVARNLEPGPHVAEVRASGGWEQWPLLAIRVSAGSARGWPSWLVWALGLGGVAFVAWGIAGISRQANMPALGSDDSPTSIFASIDRTPKLARYVLLAGLALAAVAGPAWLQLIAFSLLFALFVAFPHTGLALLAAVAPLFLVVVPVFGRSLSPAEVVIWMSAAALVVRALIETALSRHAHVGEAPQWIAPGRLRVLDWPVLALLGVAIISLATADNLGVALRELRTVIVAGALAYWLVRLTPVGEDGHFDPWPVVWGIGLGAAAVASWGVYQAMGGVGLIGAEGVWRVRGPYGSPNNLALYLDHALPILLAIAVFGVSRGRRLVGAALAALILLGLVLTFSKGALLLGLPAALLFMGFVAGGRWRWIALGLLVVGALALLPLFGTERFAGLFDLQGGTSFFRVQLWRGAWNMILDYPWLGVGLDNFLYAYRTQYALPTAWQELNLSHPHNVVLDFWTRLGFLGLITGIWLFIAAFWQGWTALRRASGDGWALLLGLLASLVVTLAHGLIDNSLFLVDLMLLFMLSIGIITRLNQELMGTQRNL